MLEVSGARFEDNTTDRVNTPSSNKEPFASSSTLQGTRVVLFVEIMSGFIFVEITSQWMEVNVSYR